MAGERGYYDVFTIDGVDVFQYLVSYNIPSTKNTDEVTKGVARFALEIRNDVFLVTGLTVICSRGVASASEHYLMRGKIMKFTEEEGSILIEFDGRFADYKKRLLTYSFDKDIDSEAGNPSKIWYNIALRGGLSASYVDSGSDIVLDKFICDKDNFYWLMSSLTKYLGWQQYDDYNNDYLRLEPVGYSSYDTKLVVGTNIFNVPYWIEKLEPMRNNITVIGASDETSITQAFTGDAGTDEFVLTNTPVNIKVTLDGVEQIMGVVNVTTTYDYSVDYTLKKIIFVTPPGLGVAVSVLYSYKISKPVQGKDYASINYYGFEREESYNFKDITTVADARIRIKELLKYLAWAFVSTSLDVYSPNIRPGLMVEVEDSNNSKYNGTYIVNKVTYNYPSPIDNIEIGSTDFTSEELFENIHTRISLLEKESETNNDQLTQIQTISKSFEYLNRILKISKATPDSGVLYWDTNTQGDWDDFDWGDDDVETRTTHILMPGNNKFREYVKDSVFYDSVNSVGVTWDTTGNDITINNAGVLYSNAISVNVPYTMYNLGVGTMSATGLVISISCDGKSTWETVTLDSLSYFIGITTDIYYKITNNTGGAITITADKNIGGELLNAAVEVVLS